MNKLLLFFPPISCFSEEAIALENKIMMVREKETMRRERNGPEKVMKHWEREPVENEEETEDKLSQEILRITATGQEENGQTEVGGARSFQRTGLGATGQDSRDVAKKASGEAGAERAGNMSRRESREIYRRPSELDQKLSGDLSGKESEGLERKVSEASRKESEVEQTELGGTAEMTTAEDAEEMGKDEKADE